MSAAAEVIHMRHSWQCCDCGHYGNSGSVCPACASRALWPAGKRIEAPAGPVSQADGAA